MSAQGIWWPYWYFHFPNYALALLFWTLIEVLDALDERDELIGAELMRSESAAAPMSVPAMSGSRLN